MMGMNPGMMMGNPCAALPVQGQPMANMTMANSVGFAAQPMVGNVGGYVAGVCKYCSMPGHRYYPCPDRARGLPPSNPYWNSGASFGQQRMPSQQLPVQMQLHQVPQQTTALQTPVAPAMPNAASSASQQPSPASGAVTLLLEEYNQLRQDSQEATALRVETAADSSQEQTQATTA